MKSSVLFGIIVLILYVRGQNDTYLYFSEVNKFYKYYNTPKTWFEAIKVCKSDNATLAIPKNNAEATVMVNYFNTFPRVKNIRFPKIMLVGFHDFFEENVYETLNGDSLQNYYNHWSPSEPNKQREENCGSLNDGKLLHDYPCMTPGVFMCQIDSINPNKTTNFTLQDYECSGTSCYKLHLDPRTWAGASSICKAEGGNLAIIRSKSEQDALVDLINKTERNQFNHLIFKDSAFIGVHDLFNEGDFMTVLGESFDDIGYKNWNPGQPDGKEKENCISMKFAGSIHDYSCDIPGMFICQKPYNQNLHDNIHSNNPSQDFYAKTPLSHKRSHHNVITDIYEFVDENGRKYTNTLVGTYEILE